MTIAVRPAQKADVGELSVVLARAFHDDPVMMWMLPDVVKRARALPRMFATLTRHHFLASRASEVASRGGGIGGATLWDPPGRWKTTRREQWLMKPAFIRYFRSRIPASQKIVDLMMKTHPEEPHWYLRESATSDVAFHLRF